MNLDSQTDGTLTLEKYLVEGSALELARRSLLGLPVYLVLAVAVVFGTPIWRDFPVWTAVLAGSLAIVHAARSRMVKDIGAQYEKAGETAIKRIALMIISQGMIWAFLAGMIIWHYGMSREAALTLTITAGLSAGIVSSLAVRLPVAFAYLAMVHPPIFITVLFVGGRAEFPFLLIIAAYTAFLAYLAIQINRSFVQHMQEQLELEKSVREAKMANQAKSEFLANISHELRTLMNGVMGMTNLLMETQLSEQQYGYGKTIHQSANLLLGILNDLLDYSKIEAEALELDCIDFSVNQLQTEVINLVGWPASEKGLELVCAIAPEVPDRLNGDIGRLRQVLINLISNSIKFTDEGSITVWIRRGAAAGEHVVLEVTVSDTGIGMPREKLKLLFVPYSQVKTSTTRKYGGTGLGLSICRHLIEIMGGEIQVESQEGVGSTFTFTVPLDEASPADAQDQDAWSLGDAELQESRVLVAETSENNREWLRILLNKAGCRTHLCTRQEELIAALKSGFDEKDPFQLVIVGLEAAGGSFEELERAISGITGLPDTPLICLVPLGGSYTPRGKNAQILTKPVRKDSLYMSIRSALLGIEESDGGVTGEERLPGPKVRRNHYRILVTDDHKLSQNVARGILENAGYRVDLASSGLEAIKAVATTNYDLVLMDCLMPEMDGWEATRAIRSPDSTAINPDVVIVALTALADESDREKCFDSGMNEYLTKPVNALSLISMIDKWLGKATPARPTETGGGDPAFDPSGFECLGLETHLKWGQDQVTDIIDSFLEDTPHQLSELQQAIDQRDMESLRIVGHRLKGSAGIIGAPGLVERAASAHQAAVDGEFESAAALASRLITELQQLLESLQSLNASLKEAD